MRPGWIAAAIALLALPADAASLPELLQAALQQPAVAAARWRVDAAQAGVSASQLGYAGGGQAYAMHARYDEARFVGQFTPGAFAAPPFDREATVYGVQYRLPIDLFGALSASRQAADSALLGAELAQRQTQLLSLHHTLEAYAGLQALETQQRAVAVQRERIDRSLARLRRELETGAAALTDVRLAESEQAQAAAEAVRLAGLRRETLASLEQLTGLAADDAATPVAPALPPDAAAALPERLAAAQAAAAEAQYRAARRALLPRLSAVARYDRFEGGDAVPDTWSVGAQLTIPIDPAGWRRSGALAAEARAADQEREAALRAVRQQWQSLQSGFDSAQAQVEALAAEVEARRALVAAQAGLEQAELIATEDRLRHERLLAAAQARLAQARAQRLGIWSAAQVLAGVAPEAYIDALR